jgi:hypothetical protein
MCTKIVCEKRGSRHSDTSKPRIAELLPLSGAKSKTNSFHPKTGKRFQLLNLTFNY